MPPLPSGTITFLLTDVEGSTLLWERNPGLMRTVTGRLDGIVEACVRAHNGAFIKPRGEGDSHFIVFDTAQDALKGAGALQVALVQEPWPPETPIRVRMALHTGEADLRDGDYYGIAVNRCARLRAVGFGGQILLSQATFEMVCDALPEPIALKSLGEHRLKDLQRPEHVFQVVHPDLPADFPPLRSLNRLPNNLPEQTTSFVGREHEAAEAKRLLSTNRIVTLTGTGGVGKTRLALQTAADLLEAFPDGVWFVELAAITDPGFVPSAVASVLGIRQAPDAGAPQAAASDAGALQAGAPDAGAADAGAPHAESGDRILEALVDFLRPLELLLILDNCEHLLASCAHLANRLLRACPRLKLVATSREDLDLPGEVTYRLPSLAVPDSDRPEPLERLARFDAVRLFVERAAAAQPSFAVTARNAPAVVQIVRRLDGIPLALELAAARVKALSVDQIAARLNDRFRLLTAGSRTALPRHQTLRALIDWSYDLLAPKERILLRRLAVFSGGWSLAAAEALGPDPDDDGEGDAIAAEEVLDLLSQLVEKSLVLFEERDGEPRYRMLETVRQYGLERLAEARDESWQRRRHRDYYLAFAEDAWPHLFGPEGALWYDRIEAEHDNLRAAMEACAADREGGEPGLRLAASLLEFWLARGYAEEGRERLDRALTHPGAQARTPARGRALFAAGWLAFQQADHAAAERLFTQSLDIMREGRDARGIAAALDGRGSLAVARGDYAAAQALFEEALGIWKELNHPVNAASLLTNLGVVSLKQRELAAARQRFAEALAIAREQGHGAANACLMLGLVDYYEGAYAAARDCLRNALVTYGALDHKPNMAGAIDALAMVASADGEPRRAARLFAAGDALRTAIRAPLDDAIDPDDFGRRRAAAREALGDEAFQAAWDEGRAVSSEDAQALMREIDAMSGAAG